MQAEAWVPHKLPLSHTISWPHPQVLLLRGVGGANEGVRFCVLRVFILHTELWLWSLETLAVMELLEGRSGSIPRWWCLIIHRLRNPTVSVTYRESYLLHLCHWTWSKTKKTKTSDSPLTPFWSTRLILTFTFPAYCYFKLRDWVPENTLLSSILLLLCQHQLFSFSECQATTSGNPWLLIVGTGLGGVLVFI